MQSSLPNQMQTNILNQDKQNFKRHEDDLHATQKLKN